MNEDSYLKIYKEIGSMARGNWERLVASVGGLHYDGNTFARTPIGLSHERVLFEAFLCVSKTMDLAVADLWEVMKVYLRRAPWDGIMVRDSSASSGNAPHGETWALVRYNGILASFNGTPFQAIYEPSYDIHNDDDDDDDESGLKLSGEERRRRLEKEPEKYLKNIFGVPFVDDDDNSYVHTVPDGLQNALILGNFANGGPGQDVVAVSNHLLRHDHAESVQEWVEKRRNNHGTASNFDILASATLDNRQRRPIVRQLRSWTEEQYRSLLDKVLMVAAVWPHFLAGQLTFASSRFGSWIVIEQTDSKPLLFERENWPIRTALARVLEAVAGIRAFRGMDCAFDLSDKGKVVFDGQVRLIIRPIVKDFSSSAQQSEDAVNLLTEQLANMGHDPEAVRALISDPLRLGELIDPNGQLLRENRAHPEQQLFNPIGTILDRKQTHSRSTHVEPYTGRSKGELYDALGGDGQTDVYLSDGLWLSSDGSASDKGR